MGQANGTGLPMTSVSQTSLSYTSTRSIFTMDVAGKVQMNITFLSPVTPDDLKRQSLVFSYLHVDVESSDGAPHDVQLYADASAEWASGGRDSIVEWEYDATETLSYHKFYRQTPQIFTEINQQAEWGRWWWATDGVDGLTHQSGADVDVRGQFAGNGILSNTKDTDFRAIENRYPVFGFAKDLGSVEGAPVSTIFSIGLTQDEVVQFAGNANNEVVSLPSLWKSYFDDEVAALSFFHGDYSPASDLANAFDSKVSTDSLAEGGQDYLTITSLAARQTFGALQLLGTLDKIYLFLKEISSNGDAQTVDVIFPAMPFILYTNPVLLKYLLEPLFQYQEVGNYPNRYSIHDLGIYPNATGYPEGNDEYMPLEECGNMLIMALAYVQATNDTDYLKAHYQKLDQWTQYLVEEAQYPANQISTDDFAGPLPNQTNLAIKGMIGIAAMGEIANLTGNADVGANYTSIAQRYVSTWQDIAIDKGADPPRTTLNYSTPGTWGTLYNLYADKLLGLDLVPQSVYDTQSAYYPTVINEFGLPLDSRDTQTKSDWEMWAAAVASPDTAKQLIGVLAKWIGTTPTESPFSDLFDTITGDWPKSGLRFTARPVQGGMFAPLMV